MASRVRDWCSNARSEIELQDAYGILVGEEGRGMPNMINMASRTWLDCVIGSAGLMRQASVQQCTAHEKIGRAADF